MFSEPKTSSAVPDFSLPSSAGGDFSLQSALDQAGTKPLLIVFFRGHWCPYCRRYLCKLQQHMNRLGPLCSAVVAISPESVEASQKLAAELHLSYPLLSDRTGKTIDAFGVRNGFSASRTLMPHPAVFIVSPSGEILLRSIDRNYKKRTTIRTILQSLRAGQANQTAL